MTVVLIKALGKNEDQLMHVVFDLVLSFIDDYLEYDERRRNVNLLHIIVYYIIVLNIIIKY